MSDGSADPTALEAAARGDDEVAAAVLPRYGLSADRARLINLSENATYLVDGPDGTPAGVLRVHRESYHSRAAIESELDWLTALRPAVPTPTVLPDREGGRVVTATVRGVERHAVLFAVVPGAVPDDAALAPADFTALGVITARLHRHARAWARPPGFTRFAWDWHHSLGPAPRWGRWEDGIGVGAPEREVLGPAADLVRERLAAYGSGPDRYGLVHADLRLANLLVDGRAVNVIDFDDSGFSWYLYDFGAAVSFLEHDPRLPQWQEAWVAGYRSEEPLDAEGEDMLATFVMLRRLLLVAWMGSHRHSRECRETGPGYTAGSLDLARRYVASGGRSLTP